MKEVVVDIRDIAVLPVDEYANVIWRIADNIKLAIGKDEPSVVITVTDGVVTAKIALPVEKQDINEEDIKYVDEVEDVSSVSDQDIKMMKAMYSGMKISVKVIVDGKIVDTNATHKDGNVVTLSEMDFDVIMNNEEAFKALSGSKEATDEEMKISMQKFKGFKADMNEEVVIKFK